MLDSVRVVQDGQDLTRRVAPLLSRSKIVLAERVEVEECQALLR